MRKIELIAYDNFITYHQGKWMCETVLDSALSWIDQVHPVDLTLILDQK